jgi:hypothetical protein
MAGNLSFFSTPTAKRWIGMRFGHQLTRHAAPLAIAAAALLPVAAQAQAGSGDWQWRASIYGWLPGLSGTTSFPTGGGGPSIDIDSDDVLDALEFALMGTLDVRKGKWGAFTDLVYADFGASKSGSRDFSVGRVGVPAGVSLNADLDIETWLWTVAGTYVLDETPRNTTQLLLGARMISIEQTLNWSVDGNIGSLGLPGRSGSASVDATNWDAIVGVKGTAALSEDRRWVLPYYLDVGTGDSDFTWQALAGIGYAFDWGTATLAWRYTDYEFDGDVAVQDLSLSGPLLGVTFRW